MLGVRRGRVTRPPTRSTIHATVAADAILYAPSGVCLTCWTVSLTDSVVVSGKWGIETSCPLPASTLSTPATVAAYPESTTARFEQLLCLQLLRHVHVRAVMLRRRILCSQWVTSSQHIHGMLWHHSFVLRV